MRTMTDVGATVRTLRLEAGLTQAQLAEEIGVSRAWVVRLEAGSPRLEAYLVLDALAALGVQLRTEPLPPPGDDPFAAVFAGLKP